jgi:hypothetical protein
MHRGVWIRAQGWRRLGVGLYNELLHLSGAVFKEAITVDRLEVQLHARCRAPLKRPPAGERGVIQTSTEFIAPGTALDFC